VFSPLLNGQTIDLTSGELAINTSLDIEGPGAANLAISGQNTSQVFSIAAGTTDTLDGLTIENGQDFHGGGIANAGALTVSNCLLTGNAVSGFSSTGGAIFNTGTLTVTNCTLTGNSAPSSGLFAQGGAISSTASGSLVVEGTRFADNQGGAIFALGDVTVTDSAFDNNQTGGGGGAIEAFQSLTVTDCVFANNQAGFGGAIDTEGTHATLTVTDCRFDHQLGGQQWRRRLQRVARNVHRRRLHRQPGRRAGRRGRSADDFRWPDHDHRMHFPRQPGQRHGFRERRGGCGS
jgi:predicted outer membrane repeat protein